MGKAQPAELFRPQVGEEVALVLDRVDAAQELAAAIGQPAQARVVAAGHRLVVRRQPVAERAELDGAVAQHVGAGRVAGAQRGQGVLDHRLPVLLLQRHHLQRHLELAAHGGGIRHVLFPRAVAQERQLLLQPDLQVEGGQLVARVAQQRQGERAVDAAGQQHRDPLARAAHRRPRRDRAVSALQRSARYALPDSAPIRLPLRAHALMPPHASAPPPSRARDPGRAARGAHGGRCRLTLRTETLHPGEPAAREYGVRARERCPRATDSV